MKLIIITLSVSFCLMWANSLAQVIPVEDFKEVPLPVLESKELYKLNNSTGREFAVSLVNGKLQITKAIYLPSIEYALPEGKLLGVNVGEFGGGLYYKPNDTTQKQIYVNGQLHSLNTRGDPFRGGLLIPGTNPVNQRIKNTILIKGGNINKIFTYRDSLYIMEGLAHLTLSFGAISKIQIKGDSVKGSQILGFDDAPFQLAIYNCDLYIATLNRFYIIHNWQKELLFNNLFWRLLYPNSIAIKDLKHIYVGMRAGYAIIDADKKSIVFYQYKVDDQ